MTHQGWYWVHDYRVPSRWPGTYTNSLHTLNMSSSDAKSSNGSESRRSVYIDDILIYSRTLEEHLSFQNEVEDIQMCFCQTSHIPKLAQSAPSSGIAKVMVWSTSSRDRAETDHQPLVPIVLKPLNKAHAAQAPEHQSEREVQERTFLADTLSRAFLPAGNTSSSPIDIVLEVFACEYEYNGQQLLLDLGVPSFCFCESSWGRLSIRAAPSVMRHTEGLLLLEHCSISTLVFLWHFS